MSAGTEKGMIQGLFQRAMQLSQVMLTRYLVASVVALAVDVAIFSLLVYGGVAPTIASAAGYIVGIFVHWVISANYVFVGKTKAGGALHLQRALFAGSAVLGLGITVVSVSLLTELDVLPVIAKGIAVILSFSVVYIARKYGVFR